MRYVGEITIAFEADDDKPAKDIMSTVLRVTEALGLGIESYRLIDDQYSQMTGEHRFVPMDEERAGHGSDEGQSQDAASPDEN